MDPITPMYPMLRRLYACPVIRGHEDRVNVPPRGAQRRGDLKPNARNNDLLHASSI